ncbi:LysR family transcriptional regulator [Acidithiobacillus sp. CV18-2]|uniref:LysR family transcriptional regulator n=1 Tax=Igneacidithiobacillus copahuensis TaxID=2724909 RepID=A0AAE2YQM3_9PROT|nr:LysR family transcriptional regulator [Igneacidithiobacillus copahuensis]MBU2753150.1 LysR family transcriptional regulator [Acidithiobacillus sp. CV18-3]MBU2756702.1 LysR family transcriptional regulator [Acidithiobacillus sp. BN09-2]MBU2776587.1 LysR family transcriptional regulator [Acidithiobacillus sp. CV18-2]MBU2796960.1 LysR family transcriptional regulator [Acidithiobacillus sp. VAN18-2]MBU2798188.1 LysR family transcriptional regulator [Acidithiobacillus sp. VAN18-4]UTV80443.1 Lys
MRHLRLFQYIDAIVREGSVRRAAEKLYVTASALDRRLQDLEEELGTRIFERHARGMRLTSAGEIYVNYIRRHIAESQRVQSEIDRLQGMQQGQVAIAVSPALASNFTPSLVRKFREQHPGISFVIKVARHGLALQYLLSFDVDLAIIIAPPKHPDVFDLAVVNQSLLAVMDKDHPLSSSPVLRLSDCLQYPLLLPSTGLTTREMLDAALRPLGRDVKIGAETNSYEVMRGLLQDSDQIGFMLYTGEQQPADKHSLVYRPINAREFRPVPIICAQLRNRGLSVAAAQFSNLVIQEMENMQIAKEELA